MPNNLSKGANFGHTCSLFALFNTANRIFIITAKVILRRWKDLARPRNAVVLNFFCFRYSPQSNSIHGRN